MEIRQVSAVHNAVHQRPTNVTRVEPAAPPPEGGLPASQGLLSKLTPGERAAIAGVTGYHLSPTGAVTNVGGVPPWSFIMAFAASRTAEPVEQVTEADDGGHVDVTV